MSWNRKLFRLDRGSIPKKFISRTFRKDLLNRKDVYYRRDQLVKKLKYYDLVSKFYG
jgi:hypothetical protein